MKSPLLALLPALLLNLGGCASEPLTSLSSDGRSMAPLVSSIDDPCGEVTAVTLYAGQTIDAGTVTVANDGTSLCVTYATTGDWRLTETHLHIGLVLGDIPQTGSGNPKVGKFRWAHDLDPSATTDEYCFLLSELGYTAGAQLLVAAHAVVERIVDGVPVQNETGWGDGLDFPGANWATYMVHEVQECNGEVPIGEGAFLTFTPAEWGADPASSPAAGYLEQNFYFVFDGLQIGCDPELGQWVHLTGPAAVASLLPTNGTAATLTMSYTDPSIAPEDAEDPLAQATEAGELLGHVVALQLNVAFDAWDPAFGASEISLGDLVVSSPESAFYGMTVAQVLEQANYVVGGCGTFTPEETLATVQAINENFVPGNPVGSYLTEPGSGGGGGDE